MRGNWFMLIFAIPLLYACGSRPSRAEERKAEIRRNDSLELAQARVDFALADSVATFRDLELQELKRMFVFEKQEKYQTTGYFVLPSYKGSKERFTFFPEVEEGGKLLFVSIDRQRRYAFTEVDVFSADYTASLPDNLTAQQRKDVGQCYTLARTIQERDSALRRKEKMELKVRFYEKKIAIQR